MLLQSMLSTPAPRPGKLTYGSLQIFEVRFRIAFQKRQVRELFRRCLQLSAARKISARSPDENLPSSRENAKVRKASLKFLTFMSSIFLLRPTRRIRPALSPICWRLEVGGWTLVSSFSSGCVSESSDAKVSDPVLLKTNVQPPTSNPRP